MTQKEFEERTKCAVKPEVFAIINQLYMATNMDKDEFCKEFKEMDDPMIPGIRRSLREIGKHLGILEAINANMKKSMRNVTTTLLTS